MKYHSLYIASRERHAGSLFVAFGLLNFLQQHYPKIAVFRPIVNQQRDLKNDPDALLLRDYFQLQQPIEEITGVTLQEATQAIQANQQHQLFEQLQQQFQQLAEAYDFVLVLGMEQTRHAANIDLDLNLELAKNFQSGWLPVLNAHGKTEAEIETEVALENQLIKQSPVRLVTMIVNRCASKLPNASGEVQYLPENEQLNTPSIQEIAEALNAEPLLNVDNSAHRLVHQPVIAAMAAEHYLTRIQTGDLIIVPGDRSDIIIASSFSLLSPSHPNIAGLILTGGLSAADSVIDLMNGFDSLNLPVYTVATDTYPTARQAMSVRAKLLTENPTKLNLALGLFNSYFATDCLLSHLTAEQPNYITPIMFEQSLFTQAQKKRQRIVLPEAEDERILKACDSLLKRQVIHPILLGKPEQVLHQAQLLGLDLSDAEIIDPANSEWRAEFVQGIMQARQHKTLTLKQAEEAIGQVSYFATMMVQLGYADGMVSGASHTTADTIRPALQIIKTQEDVSLVSSVFFMCFDREVKLFGDCAVNQNPSAPQLADIAYSCSLTAKAFQIAPKTALLSYSTGNSGQGDAVDKVAEAAQLLEQKHPELPIVGPIQYDAAIDPEVARQKLPDNPIAGQANVLIFPDLNTGNNTYKAVQRAAKAIAIGPILQGLNKPVNDLSRGCTVDDIINTVAITAIQAQQNQKENRP